ncbi:MAG: PAS domain-containing protein [Burkholderiales bacterium]|nr:PAS domain-containing protein [Burkholderiales bacterium]
MALLPTLKYRVCDAGISFLHRQGAPAPDEGCCDVTAHCNPYRTDFPVVGIGCSAGGLNALERLLAHVPTRAGIAWVVVQHLAPDHLSALPALLRRITDMTVVEAIDGMLVEPDYVYVIAPNCDLSLLHGRLHLLDPHAPRGLRLPIDFFLRSLAVDQGDRAIGIILSGMGSDGVLGLQAIKDSNGLTLVQDPDSAQADSMPRCAVEAGVADIVALPESMAGRIIDVLRGPSPRKALDPPAQVDIRSLLDKIIGLLRQRSGNDFSLYKTNTLQRRIERRMSVHRVATIDDYIDLLRGNQTELDLLFKELLIGVTSFFRDTAVWETLRAHTLPDLLARHSDGNTVRAWVAACSTGEEAYSLAMTFKEAIEQLQSPARITLQIFATDLDKDAIDIARKGLYPVQIAAGVSAERLARHFVHEKGVGYRIKKDIREMVVFASQNIISDPPFTRLDILSCRNLLIYFDNRLQKQLLPLFHYALNPHGVLVLGSAETVGSHAHLFATLDHKARIFRRIEQPLSMADIEFPGKVREPISITSQTSMTLRPDNLAQLTDQLIQQTWAPPAVLVNSEGDILYISGRTGKYLEPAAGRANVNIHAMARDGLREALVGVIHKALKDPQPVLLNGLRVGTNGGTQVVDVIVAGLAKPEALHGRVIIVFKDVATPVVRRRTIKSATAETPSVLAQELQQAREALQVTHEEMQSTVEELKSSNEELQSTNEELQSTNEELTTSKEELQSVNEELQTVNAELLSKVDDLNWVRNDMTNLLNSTEIATVFLDGEMKLRRFTTDATKIFRMIAGDVGRPLAHVVSDLDYPQLIDDALEVLHTLVFKETVATTHDGRWFRVRVMPYRTQANMIDGVVVTFTDVTAIKLLEAELRVRGIQPPPS